MTLAPSHSDTRVGPWPKSRQSEYPQSIVIDTEQAGDPNQANQGAALNFSVRSI